MAQNILKMLDPVLQFPGMELLQFGALDFSIMEKVECIKSVGIKLEREILLSAESRASLYLHKCVLYGLP